MKVHRRAAAAAALLLALACFLPAPLAGAVHERLSLTVFAAASLSEAFTEIADGIERTQAGFEVRLNFAGSQQLAAQIELGATADVYASADRRWMSRLVERGLVSGAPVTFATNRMVVIVPKDNPARIARLQDLGRRGIKLVLGADAVPVGRYARAVLANLARDPAFGTGFAERALRNVVSEEENVKSVVGKVQLGEADAGIVYRSDVTAAVARRVRMLAIPDSANVVAPYPVAVLRDARAPGAAEAFIAFLRSPAGRSILERHGLTPASAAEP